MTRRLGPLGMIAIGIVAGAILASRILPDRADAAWVEREFLAMGTTLSLRIEAPDRERGIAAIDAVHDAAWGQMVALRDNEIVRVPLADIVGHERLCPDSLYHGVAGWFFA